VDTQIHNAAAGTFDVIVIGAGHAGLAISYFLSQNSINHVVLERGEIANSWRNERWNSLKLLTPNWLSRLPGFAYSGDDPDGFMSMPEVVDFIDGYAAFTSAPVRTHTNVSSIRRYGDDYKVVSSRGPFYGRSVVVASGACNLANIPKHANDLPAEIDTLTAHQYQGPDELKEGGVLVVGGSATGLQLADEIHRSGRPVTIATGEHVRMPRNYRGRDIQWWLDASGILDERYDEVDDIRRARKLPSPQLVGGSEHRTLDFNSLSDMGVSLAGRLMGVSNGVAQFSGSLKNVCALADLKLDRMLQAFDEWFDANPGFHECDAAEQFEATRIEESPLLTMDLERNNMRTIIWATGFRPDYSWLQVPVLDRKGHIQHEGGVTPSPGLYVTGLPVLRRRKSSFIHGAEDDARFVVEHLVDYLAESNNNLWIEGRQACG